MITIECIDELADSVGIKAEVAGITRRAMNGELDFASALEARVALLEGVPESAIREICASRLALNPGAATLVRTMRANGAATLLVSGGFTAFTACVAELAGFEQHQGNRLEIQRGTLTGRVLPPILGAEAKLASLKAAAGTRRLDPAACLAVGDGANDLPMLQAAGLAVAFRPHDVLRPAARWHSTMPGSKAPSICRAMQPTASSIDATGRHLEAAPAGSLRSAGSFSWSGAWRRSADRLADR